MGEKNSFTQEDVAQKVGLRIKELERLYGIEHGGNRKSSSNKFNLKTQSDLAERIAYARRIERIEAEKARERMLAGVRTDPKNNSTVGDKSQSRDIAAQKAGIGSGKQYEREKYIVDNHSSSFPQCWGNGTKGSQTKGE